MDMLKTHFTIFTPHKKTPQYNDISYKSISEARFCPQVARYIYTHTNIYMTCKCTSELGVLGEEVLFKWRLHYNRHEWGRAGEGNCWQGGWGPSNASCTRPDSEVTFLYSLSSKFLASRNRTFVSVSTSAECNCRESEWYLCLSAFPQQFSQPILFLFFWFL